MDCFSDLPKDLVSEILSRTSPRDVCQSSAISRRFKSVADSDDMWGIFLPSDISKMVYRGVFATKKELYFRLANSFVLLNNRVLSLALDKASGKRIFMLGARELAIECRSYPVNWTCLPWLHSSKFAEVADLERVHWFDITGKIEARLLSPQTTYVVCLVFRLRSRLCTLGLIPPKAKASVRFFDGERGDGGGDGDRHGHGNEITNIVSLGIQPSHSDGQFARYRNDNWMEIELGEFFNGQGDTGEIEMRLTAVEGDHWRCDIFVEGIELRPKVIRILIKACVCFGEMPYSETILVYHRKFLSLNPLDTHRGEATLPLRRHQCHHCNMHSLIFSTIPVLDGYALGIYT